MSTSFRDFVHRLGFGPKVDLSPYKSKADEHVPFPRCPTHPLYVLNWPGYLTIVVINNIPKLRVKHSFGYTVLSLNDPVVRMLNDNQRIYADCLVDFLNVKIRFDAIWKEAYWKIENLWLHQKYSTLKALSDGLKIHRVIFRPDKWYRGTIISIPFHDVAIAKVGALRVLVPMESLVTEDLTSLSWSAMEMFVHEGSRVAMQITQSDDGHVHAKQCLKLGIPKDKTIELDSYLTKWGSLETFTRGILNRKRDGMYILVCGSNLPVRRETFFADGVVATESQINAAVGEEASCICEPGFREVLYAWIGDLEPWKFLLDKVVVPEDILPVRPVYDAVVEEFPLPKLVICRIGVIPVLVLLEDESEVDFKRGEILSISVEKQQIVGGRCCLTAKLVAMHENARFLVNFRGRVASVGTPLGTIACDTDLSHIQCDEFHDVNCKDLRGVLSDEDSADVQCDANLFTVSFEWYVMRPNKIRQTDIANYFKRLREIVKVGTEVKCTAIMPKGVQTPYCVEVCIENDAL